MLELTDSITPTNRGVRWLIRGWTINQKSVFVEMRHLKLCGWKTQLSKRDNNHHTIFHMGACISWLIGHVNEYPTMHYYWNPRHTRSMIAYIVLTEYFWKFQWKIAYWECCKHALLIITMTYILPDWPEDRKNLVPSDGAWLAEKSVTYCINPPPFTTITSKVT